MIIMKKGIRANLYLPKECLNIILNKKDEVKDYFDTYFGNMIYDIYLGEYDNKEVCCIEIKLLNKTCKEVNADYKHFKEYIKEITHKQPKQVLMFKFNKI